MKHLKKIAVTAACAALAGSMTAGAAFLPVRHIQGNTVVIGGTSGRISMPTQIKDLLEKMGIHDGIPTPTPDNCPVIPDQKPSPDEPVTPDVPVVPDEPVIPDVPDTGEGGTESQYAAEVVSLVNAERAKQGLPALKTDARVIAAAQVRAAEQAQRFSHTRPDGSSCFTALGEQGVTYRAAGENIAYGQRTPAQVMQGWMNSSGHRANILSEKFTTIGVGYAVVNGQTYWAQMFMS